MWQGIRAITNYRKTTHACDSDTSLLNALNNFYTQFEAQNDVMVTTCRHNNQGPCLASADVRKTLCRADPQKVQRTSRGECSENVLADVLTDIFNLSLNTAFVPKCLKATIIIPVPKKSSVFCHNDYHPVALTPIMTKRFERLIVRDLAATNTGPTRPNRSTDNIIATTLHLATSTYKKYILRTLMYECCS